MHGPRKLPDLVEDIYDAGLDPALWNNVVTGIRDFVGGQACGLISKDSISNSASRIIIAVSDPHYIQLYSETHSRFDPLTVLPPHGEIAASRTSSTTMSIGEDAFTRNGCGRRVAATGQRRAREIECEMPGDDDGDFGPPDGGPVMKHRLSLVVPHASRALLINRAMTSQLSWRRRWRRFWTIWPAASSCSMASAGWCTRIPPGTPCWRQTIWFGPLPGNW